MGPLLLWHVSPGINPGNISYPIHVFIEVDLAHHALVFLYRPGRNDFVLWWSEMG
jgi:hypothetical protein